MGDGDWKSGKGEIDFGFIESRFGEEKRGDGDSDCDEAGGRGGGDDGGVGGGAGSGSVCGGFDEAVEEIRLVERSAW